MHGEEADINNNNHSDIFQRHIH